MAICKITRVCILLERRVLVTHSKDNAADNTGTERSLSVLVAEPQSLLAPHRQIRVRDEQALQRPHVVLWRDVQGAEEQAGLHQGPGL